MEYGAIDLHKQRSVIRIVDAEGRVVLERTIATVRDGFERVFAGRGPMRVVVETGTESEWVAQAVEACGAEVVVVDPNYALMYGVRQRLVKTDRRDVAALAEANRLGIFRPAHRVGAAQRAERRQLRVREQLVRVRTRAINLLRAQLRQEGYRLGSGRAESTVARYERLGVATALAEQLDPLIALLTHLAPEIAELDGAAAARAAADPVTRRLMTTPGVGPLTALSYRAALDEVSRFADAGQVTAFLGLVPREDSSGSRRRKGGITKAGPSHVRTLLVQAAWTLWRQRRSVDPLHRWVRAVAARRGRGIAIVGLARRLARVLFAIWRDGVPYRVMASAA
jgi:transposase